MRTNVVSRTVYAGVADTESVRNEVSSPCLRRRPLSRGTIVTTYYDDLARLVAWMDDDLDSHVPQQYIDQPLAQDWARVAKVAEEAGEVVDAFIGITGQNPRKGEYGDLHDLADELCDSALTGIYALQHFTKDSELTLRLLLDRANFHQERRGMKRAGDG